MSRCFRYPPLGYNGTKSSDEVLIQLMKLQRESEKAKAEKKKEKKKQEKRDRKEMDKLTKKSQIQDGKYSPRSVVISTGFFERELDSDHEQMALRSTDLTAEHTLQLISSIIHKPNYASSDDSTGKSNKRRKIRPSTGMITGAHDGNEKQPSDSSSFEKELQRVNLLYKELIGCWVPPTPLKELTDIVDDQEWLFGVKIHQDHDRQAKKFKPSSDLYSCRGSSTVCPRAQYLPEADIYALPYTLPF